MIVNVDDVFYDKPRFSTLLYFGLSLLLLIVVAYVVGAQGEAGAGAYGVMYFVILAIVAYPFSVACRYKVRRKKAEQLYQTHLHQLTEKEMRDLRKHRFLSTKSKAVLDQVGYQRFGEKS